MTIVDGVSVLGWAVREDGVWVDIAGGADNLCGYLHFERPDDVDAWAALLDAWERDGRALMFMEGTEETTLLDLESLLVTIDPDA